MIKTVFVGVYETKHGVDVAVYATRALAEGGKDAIGDQFWEDEFEDEERPESDIGDAYFAGVANEYFSIEEREIIEEAA
jgi:hypothetical protein